MKKKYRLILLDTGYEVKEFDEKVDIYVNKDSKWEIKKHDIDDIGHGGAVLSIILRDNPQESYAVFKAIESSTESNLETIISALEYIYSNIECDFIQMSFGVRAFDGRLLNICQKLYEERRIIIISAFDNSGAMSFPAAFPFVIGVSGNPYLRLKNEFVTNEGNIVDVYAKSGRQIVASRNTTGRIIEQGNSFAASYVSSALLKSEKKIETKLEAMRIINSDYSQMKEIDHKTILGTKAVAFPLNKEMYSLINYYSLLKIDLVDIYDVKYSSNVGRILNDFEKKVSFSVKNIEDCDWDSFETMIIGHVRELGNILRRNIKKELLQACLEHGKNVYCFDRYETEEYYQKFIEAGLILECADHYMFRYNDGRLYQIKTPIMSVLGTSKKQGKFTLQLQIMRILKSKGVNVGMLGTEPNSKLFGCEGMVPLGYDSYSSKLTSDQIIQVINNELHGIDMMDKDVIITGGQSGVLPKVHFNLGHINTTQISFILGTMPDGVILSFSADDDLDYIEQAIKLIEALTSSKVFLLALYAFRTEYDYVINSSKVRLNDEEIECIRNRVKERLKIEVVVSGEEKYDEVIFEEIVKYYCE